MTFKKNNKLKQRAQTATELAVFGAVLIFVIGVIIRQSMATAYYQNQSYRALRMALDRSMKAGEAQIGGRLNYTSDRGEHWNQGNSSRNSATILLVEDRLTARSAKYAAVDRTPNIIQGTASFSRNLMMGIDTNYPDEWEAQLPIFDLYVNGKHFPLSAAGIKRVCLLSSDQECRNFKPLQFNRECSFHHPIEDTIHYKDLGGCHEGNEIIWEWFQWEKDPDGNDNQTFPDWYNGPPGCPSPDASQCTIGHREWVWNGEAKFYGAGEWTPYCAYWTGDPSRELDCRTLFQTVANTTTESNEWCTTNTDSLCKNCDDHTVPPTSPFWYINDDTSQDRCNTAADSRFDLNQDGASTVDPMYRDEFGWQWHRVRAFNNAASGETTTIEGIRGLKEGGLVDVDGDLKEETIVKLLYVPDDYFWDPGSSNDVDLPYQGLVFAVDVIDMQDGDVDFSAADNSEKPKPGFDRDVQMFTEVKDGTMLLVENGKLFETIDGDTKQYVRSAQRKEQIDWIQRRFQLSNNSGRFCTGTQEDTPIRLDYVAGKVSGFVAEPNPVEVCCNTKGCDPSGDNCFGDNMNRTCLDMGNMFDGKVSGGGPPQYPAIYIRSLLKHSQGRKWITNVENDPEANFTF